MPADTYRYCTGCENCIFVSELRIEYGVLVEGMVPYCVEKKIYVTDRNGPCTRRGRLSDNNIGRGGTLDVFLKEGVRC